MSKTATAIVEQPEALPIQSMDSMLLAAIDKGITPEGLEKLVSLKERMMAHDARMAFYDALAKFQGECPPISKNRTVGTGSYNYTYAELDHIAETIRPLLRACGLSYSFDSTMGDGMVKAKCVVRHVAGHSEDTHFEAPVDTKSRMNVSQQVASALSYARRYALILALGLTTGDLDDDGAAAGTERLTDEQAATLKALMEEVDADQAKFLKWMKCRSIEDIPATGYSDAVKALEQKRKAK